MIISVHIRKAAGTSFRKAITEYYGDELLRDYGDEIGSSRFSSKRKRLESRIKLRSERKKIIEKYSIIHGHFFAKKYLALGVELQYATFLRDPVERVLSNYYYLTRNKDRKNGDAVVITQKNYSLEQYIRHGDARNVQAQFLSGVPLKDFSFVGITEEYEKSVLLFNKVFNTSVSTRHNENINPQKASQYNATPEIIELIRKNNEEDLELYSQATEMFNTQYFQLMKGG